MKAQGQCCKDGGCARQDKNLAQPKDSVTEPQNGYKLDIAATDTTIGCNCNDEKYEKTNTATQASLKNKKWQGRCDTQDKF